MLVIGGAVPSAPTAPLDPAARSVPPCALFSRSAHGRSLCPSISGVVARTRSTRLAITTSAVGRVSAPLAAAALEHSASAAAHAQPTSSGLARGLAKYTDGLRTSEVAMAIPNDSPPLKTAGSARRHRCVGLPETCVFAGRYSHPMY